MSFLLIFVVFVILIMSRENTYQSFILKKQPYGEADELITLYTQEAGKLRVMAKSIKFAKSKLQYGLQLLFLARLTVTAGSLPKVIGVEVLQTFPAFRESMEAATMAQYAAELALKFTPDEEKNGQLFALLADFFEFLNANTGQILRAGLEKFKIAFLDVAGFGLVANTNLLQKSGIGFSNSRGGFTTEQVFDSTPVSKQTLEQFFEIRATTFAHLSQLTAQDFSALHALLSNFLSYQLERDIKSEKFL